MKDGPGTESCVSQGTKVSSESEMELRTSEGIPVWKQSHGRGPEERSWEPAGALPGFSSGTALCSHGCGCSLLL